MKVAGATIKTGCLASALALLAACQSTTFEKPPIAEAACDGRLTGHWNSIDDERQEDDGEFQIDVSDTCILNVSDLHQGEMRHGEPTQLHVGVAGDQRYLWVDSAWSDQRFEANLKAPVGDVYVLRYELKRDELILHTTNDKAVAHRIIDDEIPGDTQKIGHDLQNRITGGPHPQLLEKPGLFSDKPIRFRRDSGPAKP